MTPQRQIQAHLKMTLMIQTGHCSTQNQRWSMLHKMLCLHQHYRRNPCSYHRRTRMGLRLKCQGMSIHLYHHMLCTHLLDSIQTNQTTHQMMIRMIQNRRPFQTKTTIQTQHHRTCRQSSSGRKHRWLSDLLRSRLRCCTSCSLQDLYGNQTQRTHQVWNTRTHTLQPCRTARRQSRSCQLGQMH